MREAGLAPQERRIGLTAHDFVQAILHQMPWLRDPLELMVHPRFQLDGLRV